MVSMRVLVGKMYGLTCPPSILPFFYLVLRFGPEVKDIQISRGGVRQTVCMYETQGFLAARLAWDWFLLLVKQPGCRAAEGTATSMFPVRNCPRGYLERLGILEGLSIT